MAILERREAEIEARCATHPLCGDGTRFVEPNPVLMRIGDMCNHFSVRLLAERLGWVEPRRWVAVSPPGLSLANRTFAKLWEPDIAIIDDPVEATGLEDRIQGIKRRCGYLQSPVLPFDLPDYHAAVAYGAWWRMNGGAFPPLVGLSEETRRECRRKLERLGIPDGAWWAAVHVRESGFHPYDGKGLVDWRFHPPSDYDPAIDAIIRRGGYVVRVGHGREPLRPREGLVDYGIDVAARDETMDLYLIEGARFFIGGASGLAGVANVFGIPHLGTHRLPIGPVPAKPGDLYIPMRICRKSDGEPIPLREALSPPFAFNNSVVWLDRLGYRLAGNTPDELAETTEYFLDRLEGRTVRDPVVETAGRRFMEMAGYGRVGVPLPDVAPAFLRHYPELFG
jgi:putative glycosyltransferase (TIGR04372 family)